MKKSTILIILICLGIFAGGCSTTTNKEVAETSQSELSGLEDIEPIVENNWPESITRENKKTTAKNLTFEIEISEPTAISISCTTNSGNLSMEIQDDKGESIFSEKDMQTKTFDVDVLSSGTYKVIVQAKEHTGSFCIEPVNRE